MCTLQPRLVLFSNTMIAAFRFSNRMPSQSPRKPAPPCSTSIPRNNHLHDGAPCQQAARVRPQRVPFPEILPDAQFYASRRALSSPARQNEASDVTHDRRNTRPTCE
jgi:hypothetical protein